jgi:hypothetical protein
MVRFHFSHRLTSGVSTLARRIPPLGAPLVFEQIDSNPAVPPGRQMNRNLWSRTDLAAAIGHDLDEPDDATRVWPPRYAPPAVQPTSCCHRRA